jgi:hypothetical protein
MIVIPACLFVVSISLTIACLFILVLNLTIHSLLIYPRLLFNIVTNEPRVYVDLSGERKQRKDTNI